MIRTIKEMLFPCEKAISEIVSANKVAHEKLLVACGKGYMSHGDYVPKAKFDDRHLIIKGSRRAN